MASTQFTGLTRDDASEEALFYLDSGADVRIQNDGDAGYTLIVDFPDPAPGKRKSGPQGAPIQPPDRDGMVVVIERLREEKRDGIGFSRTVGRYQVFVDRQPVKGLVGFCVERQGPGDNGSTGVADHRRIEARTYPLATHAGASGKYATFGYDPSGKMGVRPWPCLEVENTDQRSGILIHCANGYLMSIGCINLTDAVTGPNDDVEFAESRRRVIELVDLAVQRLPPANRRNNVRLPDTWLEIRDSAAMAPTGGGPGPQPASDVLPDDLLEGMRVALRRHEIGDQSPYQLFFAGKGKSGASFGFMQGDLAVQPLARDTLRRVLQGSALSSSKIDAIIGQLSVHLIRDPLSPEDDTIVQAALEAGHELVDAMDRALLKENIDGVETCVAAGDKAQRAISKQALIYMALWINMAGPPTKLLDWIAGRDPMLGVPVRPPGNPLSSDDIMQYLKATHYFRENPQNFAHLLESAMAGIAKLRG